MKSLKNKLFNILVGVSAILVIASLLGIIFFIVKEAFPAMKSVGFGLFKNDWYPTWEEHPTYGILSAIVGSLFCTFLTMLFVIPLGLMTAL